MFSVIVARTMGEPRSATKAYPQDSKMVRTVAQVSPKGSLRKRPEHRERQNADVDPGDDQNVIRAGALEFGLDVAAKEGASADQRRLHQGATLARP